jgi:hypothetical protein
MRCVTVLAHVLFAVLVLPPLARAGEPARYVISRPGHPDHAGLARDVRYLFGYQLVALGTLYFVPEDVSNWTEEEKRNTSIRTYVRNATRPEVDRDGAFINLVLHPYAGSSYFLSARDRGCTRWQSFLYASFASTLYEFVVEPVAEPVSLQDLIVTPVAGSALAFLFEPILDRIRADPHPGVGYAVLSFVLDPFGETNHALDGLLGFDQRSVIQVRPHRYRDYSGVEFRHRW